VRWAVAVRVQSAASIPRVLGYVLFSGGTDHVVYLPPARHAATALPPEVCHGDAYQYFSRCRRTCAVRLPSLMTVSTTIGFGALLRQHRLAAGLSQQMLAERAGLSVAAIAALEAGRRHAPRVDTIALLVDALGLSDSERASLVGAADPRRQSPADLQLEPLAPQSLPAFPAWPQPPTALIGREREEATVARLLQRSGYGRLVTLTGSGGVGKTALALTVAATLRDEYQDGMAFVDLSALHDPALVASTIAQSLGIREDGVRDAHAMLLASLRDRQFLLVLDNFEQVVDAAGLLSDLIASCPLLAVLVTSRTALRVRAEQRFAVSPLAIPDAGQTIVEMVEDCAAVRLFVTRARAVLPDFQLDAANVGAVTAICRRLDGLPLAVELAAAWVSLLPPPALLDRLERRLTLLTRGAPDLPARQQTLRATIDWSAALLTSEEQTVFRRLGVFAGGSTLEAAEAVCNPDGMLDVLGAVGSLVDKSLLRPEHSDEPRFAMLETLREYAGEQLEAAEESASARESHAAYFLGLAETAEPGLRGKEQAAWMKRLEEEHDNLRAALRWALQHADDDTGLRLGGALWQFWYMRGYIGEARRWLAELLALPVDSQRGPSRARAAALSGAGTFAELQGDYDAARALMEESLAISRKWGDRRGIATSLNDLGVVADSQGDLARAAMLYDAAQVLFREIGDAWGTALVLGNTGYLARERGANRDAAALHAESLSLFRQAGDGWNIAFTLNNLGEVLADRGEYAEAEGLFEESLAVRRALSDTWGVAISQGSLGNVAYARGDYARALAYTEESLALFRTIGATWNAARALDTWSNIACRQGDYTKAALYSAESLVLFRSLHDAKGIARALTTSACVAREQGALAEAERLCGESLDMYRALGPVAGAVACLECLAQVLCLIGDVDARQRLERAVRLLAATVAYRDAAGFALPAADKETRERSIAQLQDGLGIEHFTAAWAEGAGLTLAQAIEAAVLPH
jgi:predicted ATPase/DNA-binding XRE family transcriptional regulator